MFLPSPASRCPHHSRNYCLHPTRTLWEPSRPSQLPPPSTTFLLGFPQVFQPLGLGPSPIPQEWHLGPSPPSSPFHSSIRTSSHPRLQGGSPHKLPTLLPLNLVSWDSQHHPCTPPSTRAPLRTLCPPTQGLCPSPPLVHLSLPIPPWHMVLPLPPGPWAPRRPLSPSGVPHLLASPPPTPIWCLHLPRHQGLARCHLGPLLQSRPRVRAGALRLQTCCPPARRVSTEARSPLGVGSPCCSLQRWTRPRAAAHKP